MYYMFYRNPPETLKELVLKKSRISRSSKKKLCSGRDMIMNIAQYMKKLTGLASMKHGHINVVRETFSKKRI